MPELSNNISAQFLLPVGGFLPSSPSEHGSSSSSDTAEAFNICLAIAYAITTLLTVLGNLICLVILYRVKDISDVTRIFMVSLTLADLGGGVSFTSLLVGSSALNSWPYPAWLCLVHVLSGHMFFISSLLSLQAVSIERFIAVVHPLRYQKLLTVNKAKCLLVYTWVTSAFVTLLYGFVYQHQSQYDAGYNTCTVSRQDPTIVILQLMKVNLLAGTPFALTVALYCKLLMVARQHVRRIEALNVVEISKPTGGSGGAGGPAATTTSKTNMKAAKTCLIVTMGFCIAWMPYLVIENYQYITSTDASPYLKSLSVFCIVSNSWWNVVIYYLRSGRFRLAARAVLKDYFGWKFATRVIVLDTDSSNIPVSSD